MKNKEKAALPTTENGLFSMAGGNGEAVEDVVIYQKDSGVVPGAEGTAIRSRSQEGNVLWLDFKITLDN